MPRIISKNPLRATQDPNSVQPGTTTPAAPGQTSPSAPTATQTQPPSNTDTGTMKIIVYSALGRIPIPGATVTISYTGNPNTPLEKLTTDSSGQTTAVTLSAPPRELSLDSASQLQPYSEYNVQVTAQGYEPVYVSGSEIFADEASLQPIRMNPLETTEEDERIIIIPAHTLFGNFPPKIPEDEIKPIPDTGEIVLSRVVIPEYIIVHDGVPQDPDVSNYWVRYKDYIKNVASCEIYSTWPENAIYANILAIMSFTLNRVCTEWYRNRSFCTKNTPTGKPAGVNCLSSIY